MERSASRSRELTSETGESCGRRPAADHTDSQLAVGGLGIGSAFVPVCPCDSAARGEVTVGRVMSKAAPCPGARS